MNQDIIRIIQPNPYVFLDVSIGSIVNPYLSNQAVRGTRTRGSSYERVDVSKKSLISLQYPVIDRYLSKKFTKSLASQQAS
jgi:hypothetical protein